MNLVEEAEKLLASVEIVCPSGVDESISHYEHVFREYRCPYRKFFEI